MVRKWWFKCAAQRVLSHIPLGRRINGLWSRKVCLNAFDDYALQQAIYHVKLLRTVGFDLHGKVALEFGTGWQPIMPYVLRFAGCARVILCDLHRYMTVDLLRATVSQLRARALLIADELGIDLTVVEKVLPELTGQGFGTLLQESGFEYRSPYDVRSTDYPDRFIDLVSSRAVLEHIPCEQLRAIMREMHRILQPHGAMVHTIDHSDHWQHFDHRISRINFLRFPSWWWRVLNSDIAYQNRLRSREHLQLIHDAGFELKYVDAQVNAVALTDARRPWIHSDYRAFRDEELAVLTTYLVAQPT